MTTAARNAADTRWLYRVENEMFRHNEEANADRPMTFLRRFAARVWRAEYVASPLPEIVAGRGLWSPSGRPRYASYCQGRTRIVLARDHRNVLVLLHELVHALGPCLHGPKFMRVYFPLLQRYAGYSRWFLEGVAASRGVRI